MAEPTPIPIDQPAIHAPVDFGGEIVVRGFYLSLSEGAIIDGDTTVWSLDSPGGGQTDAGGLIDFAAGGFHVSSHDQTTHEIHAIALNGDFAACTELGVQSPCLINRIQKLASSRLLTVAEWRPKLVGPPDGLWLVLPGTTAAPVTVKLPPQAIPFFAASALLFLVAVIGMIVQKRKQRIAASPDGQLLALAERVRVKIAAADPVIAAPLAPAIEAAQRVLRAKQVDAASEQGKRIAAVLARAEAQLDRYAQQARDGREKQSADELVRDVESALEAAEEAARS